MSVFSFFGFVLFSEVYIYAAAENNDVMLSGARTLCAGLGCEMF